MNPEERPISPEVLQGLREKCSPEELAALGIAAAPAGFVLDPSAPLPCKLRNYYKFTYADYATGGKGAPNYANSKDGRTVKRWVSAGRNSSPPDLPPLDEAGQMAAWFRRTYPKEAVPAVLVEYETTAPSSPASAPRANGQTTSSAPPKGGEDPRITSIALDGQTMDEGEQVRQARAIAKANYARVDEASRKGDSDGYRRWFPVWSDSLELLRKLEKEDRDARKASGDLVPRGPVLAEISQIVEALRIMSEGMEAKIIAELEKSAAGKFRRVLKLGRAELRAAIAKCRASEAAMFLGLESLGSPEILREKMAA